MSKVYQICNFIFIGFLFSKVIAQQDAQFTQQLFNPNLINPAYAGSDGKTTLSGGFRSQWLGFEGAPRTAFVSFQQAQPKKHFAYGVNFLNEEIGPLKSNDFQVDAAYTLVFQNGRQLALGLKGGMQQRSLDLSQVSQFNPNDLMFGTGLTSGLKAQAGAGLFYYTKKAYLGFAVPALLENNLENTGTLYNFQKRHFYLSGGYVFQLKPQLLFKPTLLAKWVAGAPLALDFSANFLIDQHFTLGLAYRHSAALSALAGLYVKQRLFVGYAFDMDLTRMIRYTYGSHELIFKFDFQRNPSTVLSPRFF